MKTILIFGFLSLFGAVYNNCAMEYSIEELLMEQQRISNDYNQANCVIWNCYKRADVVNALIQNKEAKNFKSIEKEMCLEDNRLEFEILQRVKRTTERPEDVENYGDLRDTPCRGMFI